MKLLHTSDWHLGRTTGRESRTSDHDAVLDEIVEAAHTLRPDVICNTGDLFDKSRPGVDDVDRAVDVLTRLAAIAPTVVVSGNHDKALMFRALDRLSRAHGLYFLSEATVEAKRVIELPVAAGGTVRLGAVSFQHPHHLVDGGGDPDTWASLYGAAVRNLHDDVATAIRTGLDPRTDFAVFAAHAYVGGAAWSGTERRGRRDDLFATDPAEVPKVSYAAYGHIHRPQPLPGAAGAHGRYAGSPLQLDFGEAGEAKSMVYVEADPLGPTRMDEIPLHRGRQLRRFQGTLEQLAVDAPDFGDDLCHLIIDSDTHVPNLADWVHDLLPEARVVEISPNPADRRTRIVAAGPDVGGAHPEPTLTEMFINYLGTANGPAPVVEVFQQLAEAAEAELPLTFPQETHLPEVA